MNREDIQKLLGGYATGTLTPEEQQLLFSAALEDQELFDALAREQSLREVLDDPAARAHLLAALDEKPEPWYARWWRPAALAVATASVAVLAVVAIRQNARPVAKQSVSTMAEVKPPAPEALPAAKQETDQVTPAPPVAAPKNEIRAKRQLAAPDLPVKEKVAAPSVPELPPAPAAGRPSGVTGGVPGGVIGGIAPAAPPPPVFKSEAPAKDAAVVSELREAGNQRARMLFFGPAPVSGFLDTQNAPAANAQAESAPAPLRDEKKQQQKPAEQARTMMRSTSSALALGTGSLRTAPLGIRYTLLRKTGDDTFAEIAPGSLEAGDTVEIRFEANQDGFLSVLGNGSRPMAAINLSRRMPYTTVPIEPGTDRLTVRFSRVPLTGAARPSANFLETPADAGDRATYVALNNPLSDPLVFTITLPRL